MSIIMNDNMPEGWMLQTSHPSRAALESPRVQQIPLADVQVILRVLSRLEQQVDRAYHEGRAADHAKLNRIIGGLMYHITGRTCVGEL